jgi:hypothetical protein
LNLDLRDVVLVAVSVFISLVFLVGNNWLLSINQPRYAVIDVQDVYGEKQKEFSQIILKKGTTEDDRQKAVDMAQRFGKNLDAVLKTVTKECGCILLNKSALVTPEVYKDYTQEVKARLAEKK